jgi:NADH dehydrogenase (ubiquinone) 1 alpha/beta subcomplex 1
MFFRPNVILTAASRVAATQRPNTTRIAAPAMFSRMYASLPKEDVQTRVLEVVKSFDKVDESKVK